MLNVKEVHETISNYIQAAQAYCLERGLLKETITATATVKRICEKRIIRMQTVKILHICTKKPSQTLSTQTQCSYPPCLATDCEVQLEPAHEHTPQKTDNIDASQKRGPFMYKIYQISPSDRKYWHPQPRVHQD